MMQEELGTDSVFKLLFSLKGKRNRIHYHIVMVIGCALLYLLTLAVIGFERSYIPAFITDNFVSALYAEEFVLCVLFCFILVVLWCLVCNKAKRICDMGFNPKWALWIECLRYSVLIKVLFFSAHIREGCFSTLEPISDWEFIVLFVLPILLGIYKGGDLETFRSWKEKLPKIKK